MKRKLLAIISIFSLFAHIAMAQNSNTSENSLKDAEVSIKFYNRTLYYPGNAENNPIYVHVTIRNNGNETLHFKLADDRMFSIDFKVFNLKNTELQKTDNLNRKRSTSQTVYFREISVEPDEEYSFTENLKNYVDITTPSVYYVVLNFYPDLFKNSTNIVSSKRLTLEVRPSPSAASSSVLPVATDNGSVLQPEEISPDKVVEQTLIARQQGFWDQYFLYMDLEEMLKNNAARGRRYNASGADTRNEMLREFRADLMQNRIDRDIVASPYRFQINETRYNQTKGTVTVFEWFKNNTYYVRQRDGIWQIYKYEVTNLESEPLDD